MKCKCGCEQETKIFRGKPNKYILGHRARVQVKEGWMYERNY